MQLHRVRLKNFRLHADTDVHLGPGITAIVGPNGAGKSTLLEAIAWAFYGTQAARGPRDSIRRSDAPAREAVRVDVDFSLGGHDYRVVRKLNNAELFQDGGGAPVANSHRTVSERIAAVLGMDRDEFFNTYFTGQKDLAVMASMGPADRGRFLSRLMGYERLREAQVRLKAERTNLKGAIAEVERTIEDGKALREERGDLSGRVKDARTHLKQTETRRTRAAKDVKELTPQWTEMQERRDKALATEGEVNVARQKVDEARRDFERLEGELAEAQQAAEEARALQPVLDKAEAFQKEYEALDQAAQSAGRRRDLHGESTEVARQLERVAERLEALAKVGDLAAEAETSQQEATTSLRDLETREEDLHTRWVADKTDAETRHRTLRDSYKSVQADRETIEQAGTEGKCPTCTRPLGEEFDHVLETLARQLEEIESQGVFLKRRVKQLAGEPKELGEVRKEQERVRKQQQKALNALVEARARLKERDEAEREHERLCARQREIQKEIDALPGSYDVERYEELRGIIREMQNDVKNAATLSARAERAGELAPQAEHARQTLAERTETLATLEHTLAELGYDEAAYVDLRHRFQTADHELRDAELAARDSVGTLRLLEKEMVALDKRIEEHGKRVARLAELRTGFNLHDELDVALDELRRDLNARLRPDLSEVASQFLSELTDGRYHELELTEKYEIQVLEDGLPRNVISGGEEDIANLVLRVAISQMVAERAGQPLSLLVLDEIFGGLDDDRRRNVIELLRGLAGRFPQVILITHIEQVRQGVDRVLRVQLDPRGGAAQVVEDEIELPGAEHAAA